MRSPTWRGTSSICPGRGWIKSACKVSIGERFPFHAGDLKHSLAGAMSRSSVAETWAAREGELMLANLQALQYTPGCRWEVNTYDGSTSKPACDLSTPVSEVW